jgi:hypothetical protein
MLIFHKINNLISQLSDEMTLEPLDSSHVSCGIIVRIDVHTFAQIQSCKERSV